MRRTRLFCWHISFFILILCACSVNISETPPATLISTDSSPTPPPLTGNPTQQNRIGNPLLPNTTIPVTWADLNLTGKLVYISAYQANDGNPILSIQALDLVTGAITTIFQGPEISWVYYMTVSPDEKQLVMSYSAPPQNQNPINELLYAMPLSTTTKVS